MSNLHCHLYKTRTHTLKSSPTSKIFSPKIIIPVRANYVKQPGYCRSLCRNNMLTVSSQNNHVHDRKDGFKKRKKAKHRSEKDLLLLRNYKNKNIPTGTRKISYLCFPFFFVFPRFLKFPPELFSYYHQNT